jgi:uncharacterized protein YndB with AHSA1/START domain
MSPKKKVESDRVTMERTLRASLEEVWALWTTAEGIESWWGPDGFEVKVRSLELEPGGVLKYAMTAVAPEQVAFMKGHGMPLTTEATIRYIEVSPPRRLVYVHLADFIPGVEPYDVATEVELFPTDTGVRMTLRFDRMHDEEWTKRAVMGWTMELGKLERVVGGRANAGVRP